MAKPLKDETNIVLNYIRQKTEENDDWVLIGSRDFPKLFNISQIYTAKILETVKEHPHVIYEVDEQFASRFKPYRFKWIKEHQEKIDHGLTAKQYFWLTDEEVNYVKQEIDLDDYEVVSKILKTCNLLAGDGAKQWWIPVEPKELSDLTVSTIKETEKRINFMLSKDLLIKAKFCNFYRLVLNPISLEAIKEESIQREVPVKPKQERKKRKVAELHTNSDKSPIILGQFVDKNENNGPNGLDKTPECSVKLIHNKNCCINIPVDSECLNDVDNESSSDIVKNAIQIKHSISNALEQFHFHIEQLKNAAKREEETQRSYDAFLKLKAEYDEYRLKQDQVKDDLEKSEIKIRQLEHHNKMLCQNNEDFIANVQESMDILLGNISGMLDEYILRPKYEKTNELINSRLKIAIWNIVMDTSKSITSFKSESKFPPNLK